MECFVCGHNNLVKGFKFFHKQRNSVVRKIMDSNMSPSNKLNSLMSVYFRFNQSDYYSEVAFLFNLDRKNIYFGRDIIKFVNKDKVNSKIGGKIIYHGKISKNKDYKITLIKDIGNNVSLYKATDLTNHDVRQIGHDMTHNISFNYYANFDEKIPKGSSDAHLKGINTKFNGAKCYLYLFKESLNYNNKNAFTAFLTQLAKASHKGINTCRLKCL